MSGEFPDVPGFRPGDKVWPKEGPMVLQYAPQTVLATCRHPVAGDWLWLDDGNCRFGSWAAVNWTTEEPDQAELEARFERRRGRVAENVNSWGSFLSRPLDAWGPFPPIPPEPVQTVRIRGLAERAASPVNRLGPAVTVPETLPLLLEFDSRNPIGTATLTRDDEGIHVDAAIPLTGLVRKLAERGDLRRYWPVLATGISVTANGEDSDGTSMITKGTIRSVSLSRENADREMPPWEVVPDGT